MSMLLALLAAAAPEAGPRVLRLDAEAPFVDAVIAGRPVRLRVDIGAHEEVLMDRTAAERLRLTTSKRELAGLIGWRPAGDMALSIGPVKIDGRWAEEVMRVGTAARDVKVVWFPHDEPDEADGVVSPALLPFDEVVLFRRAVQPGDREVRLPVRLDGWHGLQAKTEVGGHTLRVSLSLRAPRTIATAAAGQVLSQAGGGAMTGLPVRLPIGAGVMRPVRTVRLSRPIEIAGFSLDAFAMRISDWAGDGDPPPDADLPPDEVLVRARGDRQRAWPRLVIGMDRLATCARIAWLRRNGELSLICAWAPSNG